MAVAREEKNDSKAVQTSQEALFIEIGAIPWDRDLWGSKIEAFEGGEEGASEEIKTPDFGFFG